MYFSAQDEQKLTFSITAAGNIFYTPFVVVGSSNWSILVTNVSSTANMTLQANNSRYSPPGNAGINNPIAAGLYSVSHGEAGLSQMEDPDFSSNWITVVPTSGFLYASSGASIVEGQTAYRFLRLSISGASNTAAAKAFYFDETNMRG